MGAPTTGPMSPKGDVVDRIMASSKMSTSSVMSCGKGELTCRWN